MRCLCVEGRKLLEQKESAYADLSTYYKFVATLVYDTVTGFTNFIADFVVGTNYESEKLVQKILIIRL